PDDIEALAVWVRVDHRRGDVSVRGLAFELAHRAEDRLLATELEFAAHFGEPRRNDRVEAGAITGLGADELVEILERLHELIDEPGPHAFLSRRAREGEHGPNAGHQLHNA